MKLFDALSGGTAGGYALGVTVGFAAVALGVVAMPIAGAYFGATAFGSLATAVGVLKGVGGGFCGFVGGAMIAGMAAQPAFRGVTAATVFIGAVTGGIVGGLNELGKTVISPFKRKKTVEVEAETVVPAKKAKASKVADKKVKPTFDDAKKEKAPKAKTKKPAPKPTNAPKPL